MSGYKTSLPMLQRTLAYLANKTCVILLQSLLTNEELTCRLILAKLLSAIKTILLR